MLIPTVVAGIAVKWGWYLGCRLGCIYVMSNTGDVNLFVGAALTNGTFCF